MTNQTTGNTQLHSAAAKGNADAILFLIGNDLSPHHANSAGETALHLAASAECAAVLIDAGAEVDARDAEGLSALGHAAARGDFETAAILIGAGGRAREFMEEIQKTIPPRVANEGYPERSARAKVETELTKAAGKGDLPAVLSCLARGAGINARDIHGCTPLHRATGNGRSDIARFLIEAGANVHAKADSGDRPIHLAARDGRSETALLLLASGADINARNEDGETALIDATRNLEIGCLKVLLEAGADTGAGAGAQALHWAAELGSAEITGLLLDAGADANAPDRRIDEDLDAIHEYLEEVADGFDHFGRDFDPSENGLSENRPTPLHIAAKSNSPEVAELLIRAGARADAIDHQGRAPLDVAGPEAREAILLGVAAKERGVLDEAAQIPQPAAPSAARRRI